ncbi:DUF5063 domain-containing protein [Marinilabiliaceae bacterium JC017]|nr:DUF5063 domain-containing protein [Marinilabiliaceae bacterium JC017]
MEEPFDHLVFSKNVVEFVTVAKEFCAYLENAPQYPKKEFIGVSLKMLPLLYLKVVVLPRPEAELEDGYVEQAVDEDLYRQIFEGIRMKMGGHNDYLEVFLPDMQTSEEPLTASVAEDLTDMYQDLKNFVTAYKSGVTEFMNDALLEAIDQFEIYWGQRLVNTLRALHSAYYSGDDLSDEEKKEPRESERNTQDWIISKKQREWQDENDDLKSI